jgi:hypothetical protein
MNDDSAGLKGRKSRETNMAAYGNLTNYTRNSANFLQRKWPEERIPIDLEPIPGFNLRAQVVGQGGAYVKHIQSKTGCRVQIKGRNSGFIENSTGRESDEPMFLHVA